MPSMPALIAAGLLALSVIPTAQAALPDWSLEIDRVDVGTTRLEDVTASSQHQESAPGDGSQEAVMLHVRAITVGESGDSYGPLEVACPGNVLEVGEALCDGGKLELELAESVPALTARLIRPELSDTGYGLGFSGQYGLDWTARLDSTDGNIQASLNIPDQAIDGLGRTAIEIPGLSWASSGSIKGSAEMSMTVGSAPVAGLSMEISGLAFDSPDGIYAGLGVGARITADLEETATPSVSLAATLVNGELLLKDFYRDFSDKALEMTAKLRLEEDALEIPRIIIGDGDALHAAAQARIPVGDDPADFRLVLRELKLDFPLAYTRYLESVAAVWGLDGLGTEGSLSWSGDWSPGTARSGELQLSGLGVRDEKRQRFAITNLDGTLRTGTASRLTWDAASFQKLDLGAGQAAIALEQESLGLLEPLSVPVFGGTLALQQLSVGFPRGEETDIQLEATIDDINMHRVSQALGWPEFSGTLSGRIPGVSWSGDVINIEGDLDFQVFGGQIIVTDLRAERPFGVLPSLAANVTANDLSLMELTQTFEFGQIAGRLDGYVRDLRMLDWEPVQFDAWFGTPADGGKNDISRQAVHHLATIGGGNSTAVLTGPVLRLFNNFSYRRLGLGCQLQDNVCQIRGLEEQGNAVVLLQGAGLPKISIVAYNRAVDWPQLVAELTAVSGDEKIRVGN